MWAIANGTPLSADRTWVRDRNGSEVWLVAVKGTFLVCEEGTLVVAPRQQPVRLAPVYVGEPGASSLRYDIDLVYKKPATDILVHGNAHATKGSTVTSTNVGFRVGNITKELIVFGDRVWKSTALGLVMTDPEPFERLPVIWERAYGGSADRERKVWDIRNPVGTGFISRRADAPGTKLPNVEHPDSLIRAWDDRPVPAGFGPIDRHWSQRAKYAGTYDAAWEDHRKPLLPSDFDDRYHQCAPMDQRGKGYLRGGEQVDIWNMTPAGRLSFRLPQLDVEFQTRFADRTAVRHRGDLYSVVLEPFVPRVEMTWHSYLPCHAKVLKLLETKVSLIPLDDSRAMFRECETTGGPL